MDTVYRVQHKETGKGPYCTPLVSGAIVDMSDRHSDDRLGHPTGHNEPLIQRGARHDERFGFTSIDLLINWFGRYLDMLAKHDFEIVRLSGVTITAEGEKQCLFEKESETITEIIELNELSYV